MRPLGQRLPYPRRAGLGASLLIVAGQPENFSPGRQASGIAMTEYLHPEEEPVCSAWSRLVQGVIGVFLLIGTAFMMHYYAPAPTDDLQDQVHRLSNQVDLLKQEQAMPAMVLNRYRNSIC